MDDENYSRRSEGRYFLILGCPRLQLSYTVLTTVERLHMFLDQLQGHKVSSVLLQDSELQLNC